MVYTVLKNANHNYGLDIEDEIDHEYVASMKTYEEVRQYLAELAKDCYTNNDLQCLFSIRYDIFFDGEHEGDYWHDNEYWG